MRRVVLAALVVGLVTTGASTAGGLRTAKDPLADSYIVVFKPTAVRSADERASQRPLVAAEARSLAQAHGGSVKFVYQHALKGFALHVPAAGAAAIAADPSVAYVEP